MYSSKLEDLARQIAGLQTKYQEEQRLVFNLAVKDLFEKYPELESFGWTQYTPYFNDGDECVFKCRWEYNLIVNGVCENDDYDVDNQNSELLIRELLRREIRMFLQSLSNDYFKVMFGDHCKVTVFKDHVDVTSYRHD